eukprot:CAMPEP_0203930768 /NCGR_PEP_ID=MMETSP0359-20131031/69439_1 /ASSEMBLY_ACC=CAM_ASM_000338 /TAXON_ID=268821 /ORGANISM="Scrippsiella Hangoei, Strain SHTV-5" /LENGTH=1096 /DNA_ID=CAMNT_0050859987 /DNA_START=128 /DNA_END=3418 /DNA_ORIENTATION=+
MADVEVAASGEGKTILVRHGKAGFVRASRLLLEKGGPEEVVEHWRRHFDEELKTMRELFDMDLDSIKRDVAARLTRKDLNDATEAMISDVQGALAGDTARLRGQLDSVASSLATRVDLVSDRLNGVLTAVAFEEELCEEAGALGAAAPASVQVATAKLPTPVVPQPKAAISPGISSALEERLKSVDALEERLKSFDALEARVRQLEAAQAVPATAPPLVAAAPSSAPSRVAASPSSAPPHVAGAPSMAPPVAAAPSSSPPPVAAAPSAADLLAGLPPPVDFTSVNKRLAALEALLANKEPGETVSAGPLDLLTALSERMREVEVSLAMVNDAALTQAGRMETINETAPVVAPPAVAPARGAAAATSTKRPSAAAAAQPPAARTPAPEPTAAKTTVAAAVPGLDAMRPAEPHPLSGWPLSRRFATPLIDVSALDTRVQQLEAALAALQDALPPVPGLAQAPLRAPVVVAAALAHHAPPPAPAPAQAPLRAPAQAPLRESISVAAAVAHPPASALVPKLESRDLPAEMLANIPMIDEADSGSAQWADLQQQLQLQVNVVLESLSYLEGRLSQVETTLADVTSNVSEGVQEPGTEASTAAGLGLNLSITGDATPNTTVGSTMNVKGGVSPADFLGQKLALRQLQDQSLAFKTELDKLKAEIQKWEVRNVRTKKEAAAPVVDQPPPGRAPVAAAEIFPGVDTDLPEPELASVVQRVRTPPTAPAATAGAVATSQLRRSSSKTILPSGREKAEEEQKQETANAIWRLQDRILLLERSAASAEAQAAQESRKQKVPGQSSASLVQFMKMQDDLSRLRTRFDYMERCVPPDVHKALHYFEPQMPIPLENEGADAFSHARLQQEMMEAKAASEDALREVANVSQAMRGLQRDVSRSSDKLDDVVKLHNALRVRVEGALPKLLQVVDKLMQQGSGPEAGQENFFKTLLDGLNEESFVSQTLLRQALGNVQEEVQTWLQGLRTDILASMKGKADSVQLARLSTRLDAAVAAAAQQLSSSAASYPAAPDALAAATRSPLRCLSCDSLVAGAVPPGAGVSYLSPASANRSTGARHMLSPIGGSAPSHGHHAAGSSAIQFRLDISSPSV